MSEKCQIVKLEAGPLITAWTAAAARRGDEAQFVECSRESDIMSGGRRFPSEDMTLPFDFRFLWVRLRVFGLRCSLLAFVPFGDFIRLSPCQH